MSPKTLNQQMPGKLYGLGIGPGDPELLTLKAHRLLTTVPVVAYPQLPSGKAVARSIVAEFIRPGQIELPLPLSIHATRSAQGDYDRAAQAIAPFLEQGQDVAVLCEGDPMLYGSFMYLFNRLSQRFTTEVVPGISSILASASMLGTPLVYRQDVLMVLPATLEADILRDRLAVADAAVILKLGRHFAKVRQILRELGLLERSHYLEHATLPSQKILPIETVDPEQVPYWALILIPSLDQSSLLL